MKNKHRKIGVTLAAIAAFGLTLPVTGQPAWKRIQEKIQPETEAATQAAEPAAGIVVEDAGAATTPAVPAEPAAAVAHPTAIINPEAPGDSTIPSTGTVGLPKAQEKGNSGQAQIYLGEEANEPEKVKNVFDEPEFLKMMGVNPAFIYNAQDKADPMVFPPIRRAAIYAEYSAKAESLLREAKFEEWKKDRTIEINKDLIKEAVGFYNKILELKDPRYTPEISQKVNELLALSAADIDTHSTEAAAVAAPIAAIELPAEIAENTRGIIALGDRPMCLVGDFLLRVGDEVPRYPEVTVVNINQGTVTFMVTVAGRTEKFPVEVKGWDEVGDTGSVTKGNKR